MTCAKSCKDPVDDASRIFTRSSHKDLCNYCKDLLTGFHQDLHNIYSQDLGQDLHQICIGRSYKELKRSFHPDLKESAKMSTAPQLECSDTRKVLKGLHERYQNSHRSTARATAHSAARGCASDIKIRTTPQRWRSDTPKVSRGLREQMLYFHKITKDEH